MGDPLYTCEHSTTHWTCAEECCYPVDMLRMHEGKVWCEGCWEDNPIWTDDNFGDDGGDVLRFNNLTPFVPDHAAELTALQHDHTRLQDRCTELVNENEALRASKDKYITELSQQLTLASKNALNLAEQHRRDEVMIETMREKYYALLQETE